MWEPGDGSPLILLAGGSGVVPLRSIVRRRAGQWLDLAITLRD